MKDSRKVILIINVHSSLNAGDLALLEQSISLLSSVFRGSRIIISVNWPQEAYFQNLQDIEVVASPWGLAGPPSQNPIWKQILYTLMGYLFGIISARGWDWILARLTIPGWKNLFEAYQQADLVVGVSGNQFYSTGRYGWPFPLTALSAELAHIYRKPLYILPQSIGPLKRFWEKKLLTSIYGRARLIFLRDQTSITLAGKIGIPTQKVHFAPDPAFDYLSGEIRSGINALSHYGYRENERNIGMTIIAPMGRSLRASSIKRYYEILGNIILRLSTEFDARVYIFNQVVGPTIHEDDRMAVENVLSRLPVRNDRIRWVNDIQSPALLKECYGLMGLFIASRLHSGIFALSMKVPTVFIGYLSKTQGMMESIGLEEWVLDLEDLEETRLWETILRTWDQREIIAQRLDTIIPELQAQIHHISHGIQEDFSSYANENKSA